MLRKVIVRLQINSSMWATWNRIEKNFLFWKKSFAMRPAMTGRRLRIRWSICLLCDFSCFEKSFGYIPLGIRRKTWVLSCCRRWGACIGWMLRKNRKFVYNACLLNYYCYLCGKLRKKLRMLRHGASQGNPKGLPCCHFIRSPSTSNGLTSPLSYIHTSFIAFGDCLCRAMICLRINLSEHPFVLFITMWSDCSIPCERLRPTFFLLHGLTKLSYS